MFLSDSIPRGGNVNVNGTAFSEKNMVLGGLKKFMPLTLKLLLRKIFYGNNQRYK